MGTIKRIHTTEFKKNVVLALLKEAETVGQICSKFGIHPTQARRWREKVLAGIPEILSEQGPENELQKKDILIEELYKQIGQQKVEVDWLKKKVGLVAH